MEELKNMLNNCYYDENITVLREKVPGLYYITQYADAVTDDDQVYRTVARWIEINNIDINVLSDLITRMPSVSDAINQKIFNILTSMSNDELARVLVLYDALISESIDGLDDLADGLFYDWLAENEIATPEEWAELADMDLRENGIHADALYWVNEIDYNYNYLALNGYANGFEGVDMGELIWAFIAENIEALVFNK